jgi:hypothetical protein
MQPLLCVAAIAAATSVLGAPAHAQNYPWCARNIVAARSEARRIAASSASSSAWLPSLE